MSAEALEVTHEVSATFYTADCVGCSGITSTGIDVRNRITNDDGLRVIAVDPAQIPLGSTVKVALNNGEIFTAVAGDIGGAITYGKIDVLVATKEEALRLGRQGARVEVLSE